MTTQHDESGIRRTNAVRQFRPYPLFQLVIFICLNYLKITAVSTFHFSWYGLVVGLFFGKFQDKK